MALPSIFVIIIPRTKIQRVLNAKKLYKNNMDINYYYIKYNDFYHIIIIFFLKKDTLQYFIYIFFFILMIINE